MAVSGGGRKKIAISASELKRIQALESANQHKPNFQSILLFPESIQFSADCRSVLVHRHVQHTLCIVLA